MLEYVDILLNVYDYEHILRIISSQRTDWKNLRPCRDVKMHAPGASLSGSEQVFKQATEGKISPWISVV